MLAAHQTPFQRLKPDITNVCLPAPKAVVLVAKNGSASIADHVNQLAAAGNAVVVVDDASIDGTPELAAGAGAWVIRSGRDLSFSCAVQQGVYLASKLGEQILVMRM